MSLNQDTTISPAPREGPPAMSSAQPSESDSVSSNTDNSTSTRKSNSGTRRYVRTGIGGKGNYHKVDPAQASGSVRVSIMDRCKRPFRTGIGGAGNRSTPATAHDNGSAPVLSPAAQVALVQTQREQAAAAAAVTTSSSSNGVPAYHHVGIGGTGNRAKRDSMHTSQSEAPLLPTASSTSSNRGDDFQYSDQPLRVGAADKLAAKLFGIRR